MKKKQKPLSKKDGSASLVGTAGSAFVLRTTCGRELWAGCFGINENGDQPECTFEIEVECEEDQIERDKHGVVRPCFAVKCPSCGGMLEWPQEWEIVSSPSQ